MLKFANVALEFLLEFGMRYPCLSLAINVASIKIARAMSTLLFSHTNQLKSILLQL
jgi:hypothetical protein